MAGPEERVRGIEGRSAIVTGAGGAIGAAACRRLVEEGARVLAVDVHEAGIRSLADEFGDRIVPEVASVADAADTERFVELALSELGSIDLFFANAGVESMVADILEFDPVEYRRVFDVNVLGSFLGGQAVARAMLAQGTGGSILFTASTAALKGVPGLSVYAASKHAVLGIARSLALELGGRGIRVNALCPGPVDTRMMRAIGHGRSAKLGISEQETRARVEAGNTLGRYATAEEIASAAIWLLSDECSFMNNEVVTVTGGGV